MINIYCLLINICFYLHRNLKSNQMSIKIKFLWNALNVASWIIFLGFCIQTGALIFNYIFSLYKPIATQNLHLGLNLSEIYEQSKFLYTSLFSLVIVLSAIKAHLFFLVVKIFMKMNLVKPFSEEMSKYISKIGYYALSIGLLGYIAYQYSKGLIRKGYNVDAIDYYWNDSDAFLLMSAILFVIAMIFRKGIELQNENELTV